MNSVTGRHEWTYAGETFSVGEDANLEWATRWKDGTPTWTPVLRAQPLSIVTVAVDACCKEIVRLSLLVDELEAKAAAS